VHLADLLSELSSPTLLWLAGRLRIRSFDDAFVLIHVQRPLGSVEDDEHVVPRVGDDRAEPDLRKRGVAVLS
jgi:hypothetical protein